MLIRRGVSDYCPPAVPLLPAPGRAAARSCLLPALLTVPALEEQPHAFRDGRAARGPTIHCADIHGQPVSELALGQADAPQGATELSRGRRHGASIPGLVRTALCRHYAYTYRKSVRWVVAAGDAPANFWCRCPSRRCGMCCVGRFVLRFAKVVVRLVQLTAAAIALLSVGAGRACEMPSQRPPVGW